MGDTDVVLNESKTQETSDIKTIYEDRWNGTSLEVVNFLCLHQLHQYARLFCEQGIDLDTFLTLNEDDLCHLGMTNPEHRRILVNGISRLNKSRIEDKSETILSDLSPDEVARMLNNTLSHLFLIHASLAHTRYQLHRPGVHNTSLNVHMSSAHLLDLLSSEALVQAKLLSNQLATLLDKKPGAVEKRMQLTRRTRTLGCITMLTTIAIFAYCLHRRL